MTPPSFLSEQFFQQMLDQNWESVVFANLEGEILYTNPAADRLYHYEKGELLGQNVDIFNAQQTHDTGEIIQAIIEKGRWSGQLLQRRKDDSTFWALLKVQLIYDENDRAIGYASNSKDVTQTEEIDLEVQQSREHLMAMIESSPDPLWFVDPSYRLITCNRICYNSTLELYDFEMRPGLQVLDKLQTIYSPEDFQDWKNAYDRALNGETVIWESELTVRGHTVNVEYKISPILMDDQILGCLALSRNITEQKMKEVQLSQLNTQLEDRVQERTQELLVAKERAEAADLAKTQFLANMSHEIRTPMNIILGYVKVLEEQNQDSEIQYFLDNIRLASNTLLRLMNDILDLSKMEAGKLHLSYEAVDLRDMIHEVSALFSIATQSKNLDFQVHVRSEVPRFLVLDGVRFRQILFNLIGNAIKFTHEGSVQVELNVLGADSEQLFLGLSVSDTGIGIHPDFHERIFDAFVQYHPDPQKQFDGTGLGLAITRRLLEIMGGTIQVQSAPQQGARFLCEIPALKPEEQATAAAQLPEKPATLSPERVLLETENMNNTPSELLIQLEKELWELWLKVRDSGSFDEIKNFSQKIVNLGHSYESKAVLEYGQRLQEANAAYKIIRIGQLLAEYPALVWQLKNTALD